MKAKLLLFIFSLLISTAAIAQKPAVEMKEYAQSAPRPVARSPKKLAKYLTKNETSEAQKVFNIYTWITHNIRYDVKAAEGNNLKNYTAKQVLKRGKGVCGDYSALFKILCLNAGIQALEIYGYSKGVGYSEHDRFYQSDHAWNSVKIDSAWYLVDATWGAGGQPIKRQPIKEWLFKWFKKPYLNDKHQFQPDPTDRYFMTAPEIFIKDHLPADPNWQLLKHPVSVQSFENPQSSSGSQLETPEHKVRLDHYATLSEDKFFAETALQANRFNPENFRLLSIAYFNNAHAYQELSPDLQYTIQQNNERADYFQKAASYARQHQRSVGTNNQVSLKEVRYRIRNELSGPAKARSRSTDRQLRKLNRLLLKEERTMQTHKRKIRTLKKAMERYKPALLNIKRFAESPDPALVSENKKMIAENEGLMEQQEDSVINALNRFEELTFIISSSQKTVEQEYAQFNRMIENNSLLIVDNPEFKTISQSADQIEEKKKRIEQLQAKLFAYEDSLWTLHRSIIKLQSAIRKKAVDNQKMLRKNCSYSNGKACDNRSMEQTNRAIRQVDDQSLELLNLLFTKEQKDFSHFGACHKLLSQQTGLLKTNERLIAYYEEKKMERINSRKERHIAEMGTIIEESEKAIQQLKTQNQELNEAIRQEVRAR